MEIRTLNKLQLKEFISSDEYESMPFVPISRHRAISHINNPRADESDILLVLIYENREMLGYMGIFPDNIFTNSGQEKIGWLSCLWVNPKHRGRQIAYKLLSACYNEYGGKIILTEYTEAAGRLYKKSGYFLDSIEKKGIKLYIRSDFAGILPPKKQIYSKLKFVFIVIDFILNLFINLKFLKPNRLSPNINLTELSGIDTELSDFISAKQSKKLFGRYAKELNYIIEFPWILPLCKVDDTKNRYHFSAFDKSFDFIPIKITDNSNQIIAFILFAKRGNNLKMPYACFEDKDILIVCEIIKYYIRKYRILSFLTYYQQISEMLKESKTPAIIKREIYRRYLLSKYFKDKSNIDSEDICDGDGDCSFT